jgi:hypothetical protein
MFGLFLVFWFLIRVLFISFRFLFSLHFLFRFLLRFLLWFQLVSVFDQLSLVWFWISFRSWIIVWYEESILFGLIYFRSRPGFGLWNSFCNSYCYCFWFLIYCLIQLKLFRYWFRIVVSFWFSFSIQFLVLVYVWLCLFLVLVLDSVYVYFVFVFTSALVSFFISSIVIRLCFKLWFWAVFIPVLI